MNSYYVLKMAFLSVVHTILTTLMQQAPEESSNRESVNKRKRGRQPRKFISTEPNQKQKTGTVSFVLMD